MEDIGNLQGSFRKCEFLWTRRESNKAAHEVATLSLSGTLFRDWCHRLPLSLRAILADDSLYSSKPCNSVRGTRQPGGMEVVNKAQNSLERCPVLSCFAAVGSSYGNLELETRQPADKDEINGT